MTTATIRSQHLAGLTPIPIEIHAEVTRVSETYAMAGSVQIRGLAESARREAYIRVKMALATLPSVTLRDREVVVEIQPLDLDKTGSTFDMAIAAAILAALGTVPAPAADTLFLGAFHAGSVQYVRGVLPHLLRWPGLAYVPAVCRNEARMRGGPKTLLVGSIGELVEAMRAPECCPRADEGPDPRRSWEPHPHPIGPLEDGRRALPGLLYVGPPGAEVTRLAREAVRMMPELTPAEAIEVACNHSAAGLFPDGLAGRPFRAPHHTVSEAGLCGDSRRPGEAALAHLGVLYLGELPEFRLSAIESLRSTLKWPGLWPCKARIIASAHPCPCGGGRPLGCDCGPDRRQRWNERVEKMRAILGLERVEVSL